MEYSPEFVYISKDGCLTQSFYDFLGRLGWEGKLAVALFRAQKRSSAAKTYKYRKFRRKAYDVKNWSLEQISLILSEHDFGYPWGWKQDPKTKGYGWVLYVDLPTGQCSFHSKKPCGLKRYEGEWNGRRESLRSILAYCNQVIEDHGYPRDRSDYTHLIEPQKSFSFPLDSASGTR